MGSQLNINDFIDFLRNSNILNKYNLYRIGLFGSFARGEESNDIDILIGEFSDYHNLISLKDELESIFHRSIDIVLEKYANPILLHRAQKDIIYVTVN
jgi:uncharacterized protein